MWFALTEHGVSARLVWMMQCFYHNQHDRIQCGTEVGTDFEIKTGVRQGCVLSPGFFYFRSLNGPCPKKKRGNVEHEGVGIDFGGFKCAETLCFFEQAAEKCVFLMGMFMDEVAEVGPVLNPNKPIVLQTKFHRQLF